MTLIILYIYIYTYAFYIYTYICIYIYMCISLYYIYIYVYVYISLSMHIYIYIYVDDVLSPPWFLTTLQYTNLHGKESLGIIFPTFPKKLKKTRRNMNNSKTNSNNINTGYLALDPTANKYLSGSGWEISVLFLKCFVYFPSVFLFKHFYVFFRL